MSVDQILMFVHVGAAIVWVGTALLQVVLGVRVVRAADPFRVLAYARDGEWAGLHLYAPANVLVLLSGLLLVRQGGFGFGLVWIDVSLAGWLISVLTGALLLKPRWARAAAIEDAVAGAVALRAAVHRLVALTTVDLAVLTGVVYAMTVKPTGDQPVTVAVGAAVVGVVLALAGRLLRSADRATRKSSAGARPQPDTPNGQAKAAGPVSSR